MAGEPTPIDISQIPALLSLAEEVRATRVPRVLRSNGEDVAILAPAPKTRRQSAGKGSGRVPGLADPHDIWAGYDPDRVLAALRLSAGALAGIDREELQADLQAQREQDSTGRPGWRRHICWTPTGS